MEDFEELKKYANILLVDDDIDYIQVTAFFLKSKGYNVDIATSGADAISKVSKGNIHIVLLDYYMPELTGEDVINKIREFNDKIIIILQTGFAGQQPPEETLKRLNIQNYHDKSDGVEKLLLQVTSAVRIFNQQNLIELSKYRVNAIGKLVKGIAEELKSSLLSVGASIEATKMLIDSIKNEANEDTYSKINSAYANSKNQIERIDKICKTIINQSGHEDEKIGITVQDIFETLKLMIASELRNTKVVLNQDINIKEDTYIYGKIDDIIFIICEIIHRIIEVSSMNDIINLEINETENSWCISITSEKIKFIESSKKFIIKSIINGMEDVGLEETSDKYVIKLKR